MTIVFQFPGQSSRYPGMFETLIERDATLIEVVETASEVLGRDLRSHYAAGNDNAFDTNRDVQLGVFVANHLALTLLTRRGIQSNISLGLSLGEWNHLVHIDALSFEDALRAVDARGRAYDDGPRGAMAAVFPLDLDSLASVIATEVSIEIVNRNSPRQNVIAGPLEDVERVAATLEHDLGVCAVLIERSIPMHHSSFGPVAEAFRPVLAKLPFRSPCAPYRPNRTATVENDHRPSRFVELLASHVCRPVRWRESIDAVLSANPNATIVEVGPKTVLTDLLDRRWHRGVRKIALDGDTSVVDEWLGFFDHSRNGSEPTTRGPSGSTSTATLERTAVVNQPTTQQATVVAPPPSPDRLVRRARRHAVAESNAGVAVDLGVEAIERMIPHRSPMRLIDRVQRVDLTDATLRASRRIDPADPVLAGHFPGAPVYPGCLLMEAMGQASLCLHHLLEHDRTFVTDDDEPRPVRLLKVHQATFLRECKPGDELTLIARRLDHDGFCVACLGQVMVSNGDGSSEIAAVAVMDVYLAEEES